MSSLFYGRIETRRPARQPLTGSSPENSCS